MGYSLRLYENHFCLSEEAIGMKIIIHLFCLIFIIVTVKLSASQNDADLQEHLGVKLPLNLYFADEDGNKVLLKDLVNKPTIIDFVYYECPGICSPLMTELAHVANNSDLKPGEDYRIISISFDETETPQIAAKKKKTFLSLIDKKSFPDSAWKFLTGDSLSIDKLSRAAGFMFKRTGETLYTPVY